jgi:micrococcal nuclease
MSTLTSLKSKSKLYYYVAQVTKVYDGDTITVDLDLGLGLWRHAQTIRLWRVNTPELRGEERERGLQVRDFVRDMILDKPILLRTILDRRGQDRTEKFGRLLGEVLVESEDGELLNVNDLLLEQGMGLPVDEGGTTQRAISRSAEIPLPDTIRCPFCGEMRTVAAATAMIEQCPNCLDEERDYSWFLSLKIL